MSSQQRNQAFKQIHVSTVTALTRHPRRDARPERHAAVCTGPVQRFAAEAAYEYHISTRHASLTARFVACLFLHTQICGKNIALRGVFLIDKLPPPRSKIDINMCKVHKFLSTT